MHVDRRLIGLGLFLIVFGAVLLAVRQGLIASELAERVWTLWPLLLIGAGVGMILEGRPGGWLGGLLAAVTLGVMAGGLVATGALPLVGCGGGDGSGRPFPTQSADLADTGAVRINLGCGDLVVTTTEGSTVTIDGTSEEGRPPDLERADGQVDVTADRGGALFGIGTARNSWRIALPRDPAILLEINLNAGEGDIRLAGARLSSVELDVNAGSTGLDLREVDLIGALTVAVNAGSATVWLPDRPLEGSLAVNAGSIAICAPESIGLRITTNADNPTSSNDFEARGLVRAGDAWESPEFKTADVRIILDAEANAGSLSLDSDECTR